jgi:hypothetical protein
MRKFRKVGDPGVITEMNKEQEIKALKKVFVMLLDKFIDIRRKERGLLPYPDFYSVFELSEMKFPPLYSIMDKPLSESYRHSLKRIGERLYKLGGKKLMHKFCDNSKHPDAVDHIFNGIGKGNDRWWC